MGHYVMVARRVILKAQVLYKKRGFEAIASVFERGVKVKGKTRDMECK